MKFLFDIFPVLLFFIAFKMYDIYVATAVAIAASFVQVGIFWLQHRRFENMHLITLAVMVVFGGATLILQDDTFIMWKPTIINWAFGLVFIGSQYIGAKSIIRRMMDGSVNLPDQAWVRLNAAWGTFFILLGFLNLYVAFYGGYSLEDWVNFKVFGMTGLSILFIILQTIYIVRFVKEEPEKSPSKEES